MYTTNKQDIPAIRLTGAGTEPIAAARERTSVQEDRVTNRPRQIVPSSSIYLHGLRSSSKIAVEFAEFPIAARILCLFEVGFTMKYNPELHINNSPRPGMACEMLGAPFYSLRLAVSVAFQVGMLYGSRKAV